MRILFTQLLILFAFQLFAQERTISGTLTSKDGSPLPGINILIKGTSIGTTTDINGYYVIKAPVGATLVFSFIGMKTQEIVVTDNNLKPARATSKKENNTKRQNSRAAQSVPRSLYRDTLSANIPGVSVLTDATSSFNPKNGIDPSAVRAIVKTPTGYTIRTDNDPVKRSGFGLQFSSSISIERINKLPSLQHEYAQGQPRDGELQWRGADQQEIYSWGPLIRTLEFDGSQYPFDKSGRLVSKGTGNGSEARTYDPLSFFRTGSTIVNELMITLPGPKNGNFIFDLENRSRSGIIPNSRYKRVNFSTSLKNFQITNDLRATASVSFNNSSGNLLNRGANYATIIGSVYRTPSTFDNTNNLSARTAASSQESYQLPNDTHRSHAPALVDNPFGLVNELPDHEKHQRLLGSLNLNYNPTGPFDINVNGSIDRQWSENIFGIPPAYAGYVNGRLTHRQDYQTFANAIITPSYRHDTGDGVLQVSASYQTQYTKRQLNRLDGFDFRNITFANPNEGDSTLSIDNKFTRTSHEIIVNAQYEHHRWLNVRFSNRNYFSSTVNSHTFTNLFPAASVGINLVELLDLWSINYLNVYASISRTLREASLLYSDWAYGSTPMELENYSSFYEASELYFNATLAPETERKFETGIKFNGLNGFRIEMAYFDNQTTDFIAPVRNENQFQLQNAAAIKNYGGTISLGTSHNFGNTTIGTDLVWSKYTSLVKEIYSTQDRIALAGFQSTQTVLAVGKPVGAIYGSTYQRNNAGKFIIDKDGFPLKDLNYKMIGNPIPDWTLGWSSYIQWKQLRLAFLFDFKKGGQIWNGTNAVLDYLGKSTSTSKLRNTSNYVFEGVDVNGNPSTIPVNFADPTLAISENRWVRYGWDGIGEDYIEDASWIRLNELTLSYTIKRFANRTTIREVKFSLIGNNILLITPYSGVDPSSALFGYGSGNGLDLFNAPATRRYSALITIKI